MDFNSIDGEPITGLRLLLLIGIGPKIALVPFLEKRNDMDARQKRELGTRVVTIAIVASLILFFAGAFLLRLLHITGGAAMLAARRE